MKIDFDGHPSLIPSAKSEAKRHSTPCRHLRRDGVKPKTLSCQSSKYCANMTPPLSKCGLLLQRTLRMIEKLRRDRVELGLIGLGPGWDQTYRETLIRLQNRISIRLVYDSVEARARTVAFEFDADVADSMRQILFRPGLQGLLVLDLGWCGAG